MESTDQSVTAQGVGQDSAATYEDTANEPESNTTLSSEETSGPVADSLALVEASPAEQAPISRVIDVPLTVTLRFGQRQLTVRELLELNTGSLVELDQQVEEPVNLMLGERIIARGEVVIVDGNYGMRVLEVVEHSAAQRLAALGRL